MNKRDADNSEAKKNFEGETAMDTDGKISVSKTAKTDATSASETEQGKSTSTEQKPVSAVTDTNTAPQPTSVQDTKVENAVAASSATQEKISTSGTAPTSSTTNGAGNSEQAKEKSSMTTPSTVKNQPAIAARKGAIRPTATQTTTHKEPEREVPEGVIPYLDSRASLNKKFRHYIETRWYPQWKFYDNGAASNKRHYLRYQVFIALGSVAVPIIIGIGFIPKWIPAVISGAVAAATAIENVQKYGDNWRAFRRAAEGLNREKVLYEGMSGPYATTKAPFRLFVERCEDVIAEETGRYIERSQQPEQKQSEVSGEDGE